MTVRYFAGFRNRYSALVGLILGTVSGYFVGNYFGEKFAIRCGTSARQTKIQDKQQWQFYAKVKYAEQVHALGFSDIRIRSPGNSATLSGQSNPYIDHWSAMVAVRIGPRSITGGDFTTPTTSKSQPTISVISRVILRFDAPPAILRCPSEVSSAIRRVVQNSITDDFIPLGEHFVELRRLRNLFVSAEHSRTGELVNRVWQDWMLNGLSAAEFAERGGISALMAMGSTSSLREIMRRTSDQPIFEGPAWEQRRAAILALEANSFDSRTLGPEAEPAFKATCDKLLAEIEAKKG